MPGKRSGGSSKVRVRVFEDGSVRVGGRVLDGETGRWRKPIKVKLVKGKR